MLNISTVNIYVRHMHHVVQVGFMYTTGLGMQANASLTVIALRPDGQLEERVACL